MIEIDEFVERLCRLAADRGPRRLPRRRRDREILAKSITMQLDSERIYSERDIDTVLLEWKDRVAPAIETDHVSLRRLLVDYGELERSPDGHRYRVGFPPRPVLFALEVDELDLAATVAAYRAERERQSAERQSAQRRRRHAGGDGARGATHRRGAPAPSTTYSS